MTTLSSKRSICAAFLSLCWGICGLAKAQEPLAPILQLEAGLQHVIEESSPSLVAIMVLQIANERPLPAGSDPFDVIASSHGSGAVPTRFGSGVILKQVRNELFILTNAHLIEPAIATPPGATAKIYVRNSTRQTFSATIYASDPRSDLAVINVSVTNPGQLAMPVIGDAADLKRGSLVLALGNPLALARDGSFSASLGMVSNFGRKPFVAVQESEDELIHALGTLMYVDAKLPIGMSGGGLFNLQGQFVGLTTSLAAIEGYESNSGFAIPMDAGMRRIVETLLNGYEVEYGFLGMTPDDALPAELDALRPSIQQASAARVSRIATNSPALRAGIEVGDVVLSVNGVTVFNKDDLIREVSLLGPSATAELYVWRLKSRELTTIPVTLGKWPVYDDTQLVATNQRFKDWRGVQVDYPTARQRYLPNRFLTDYPAGVVVTSIAPNSPAAQTSLKVGQFIAKVGDQPVETPSEFYEAAQNNKDSVSLTLWDETVVELPPANEAIKQ